MKRNVRIGMRLVGLFTAMGVLAGCPSQTRIVDTWEAPQAAKRPLGKTLVLALADRPGVRQSIENRLAAELRDHGVRAVPAAELFPPGKKGPERSTIEAILKQRGFETVLVSRIVGERTEATATTVPSGFGYAPYVGPVGWWDYYPTAWAGAYGTTMIDTYEVVTVETRLFDLESGDLLWSAWSETTDPEDLDKTIPEFNDALVKQLVEDGIVPEGGKKS